MINKYNVVHHDFMSSVEASEENVISPSTYGNEAYQQYRKKEKKKNTIHSEKKGLTRIFRTVNIQ
jgi:hypothetical protein